MSVNSVSGTHAQITSWSTESVVCAEIKTVGSVISDILMCSTARFDNYDYVVLVDFLNLKKKKTELTSSVLNVLMEKYPSIKTNLQDKNHPNEFNQPITIYIFNSKPH